MKKVGYIGFSDVMIDEIYNSNLFSLKVVFCDKNRLTPLTIEKLKLKNILLIIIENKFELQNKIDNLNIEIDFFIIYKTSLIIPVELIEKIDFYNFHPGSLKYNRGAHPTVWSILLGEIETEMSLHKISSRIDLGTLIDSKVVQVDMNETPDTLYSKLELYIPSLFESLINFIRGKISGEIIDSGIYRKKIKKEDYTINLSFDSDFIIHKKICSQKSYFGAILTVGNLDFYCIDFLGSRYINDSSKNTFKVKGDILTVFINKKEYRFAVKFTHF